MSIRVVLVAILSAALLIVGCSGNDPEPTVSGSEVTPSASVSTLPTGNAASATPTAAVPPSTPAPQAQATGPDSSSTPATSPATTSTPAPAVAPGAATPPATTGAAAAPSITPYSVDQLFAAGGGGCGSSLSPTADQSTLLYYRGLEGGGLFGIDGQVVELPLTQSSGEEYYSGYESMTFSDDTTTATVTLRFGEDAGPETRALDGDITITRGGVSTSASGPGSAGC